jgi:hypothetical protein
MPELLLLLLLAAARALRHAPGAVRATRQHTRA